MCVCVCIWVCKYTEYEGNAGLSTEVKLQQ